MKTGLITILLMFATSGAHALDAARLMPELTWEKRVLLTFAPDRRAAGFRRQVANLEVVGDGLLERHMTVIRVFADSEVEIDGVIYPDAAPSFYRRFDVSRSDFRVILVGKDGTVKLDRSRAVDSDDLFALIDSMPMRQYEMQRGD